MALEFLLEHWKGISMLVLLIVISVVIDLSLKKKPEKKISYLIGGVFVFLCTSAAVNAILEPVVKKMQIEEKIIAVLEHEKIFQALKVRDLARAEKLKTRVIAYSEREPDGEKVLSFIMESLVQAASDKVLTASDKDVVRFFSLWKEIMKASMENPACFSVFYPDTWKASQKWNESQKLDLSEDLRMRLYATLADAVLSSDADRTIPSLEDTQPYFMPLYARLEQQYGKDVYVLIDADAATVGEERVCAMKRAFDDQVFKLKQDRSAQILRAWFSSLQLFTG